MTTTDDILAAARKRLDAIVAERATLDAEEAKLRRMIAAADGPAEPAKLAPVDGAVDPLAPWWVNPGPYTGQIVDKGYTVS